MPVTSPRPRREGVGAVALRDRRRRRLERGTAAKGGVAAERGNATVLTAIGCAALLTVVVVGLQLAGAVIARHSAEAAADLAALAGAGVARFDPEAACAAATEVVDRNGARMQACRQDGHDVLVEAAVDAELGVFAGAAIGRARAGPVGDRAATGPAPGGLVDGTTVRLPDHPQIPAEIRGAEIRAPTPGLARGIAVGLAQLGLPYVWGGGGDGGGPDDGCARGGGELNSCQGLVGFDCSGLTAFVLVAGGYPSPGGDSGAQRTGGQKVGYSAGLAGDIVGFPGHVAIYLGRINGAAYILEASSVGTPVRVAPLAAASKVPDPTLHRHWS